MKSIKKHGKKMLAAAGILGATFMSASTSNTGSDKASKCNGSERWIVKTLQDETAHKIHFSAPKTATIENIIAIERDPQWTSAEDSPRFNDEFQVYTVRGKIPYVKPQDDGDIHIEFSDGKNPEHTLVAEIPNPNCPNVRGSEFADKFKKVRNDWLNKYQDKSVYSNGEFEITGVLFFDKKNHGKGGNDNGVEIHPIMNIKKLK